MNIQTTLADYLQHCNVNNSGIDALEFSPPPSDQARKLATRLHVNFIHLRNWVDGVIAELQKELQKLDPKNSWKKLRISLSFF